MQYLQQILIFIYKAFIDTIWLSLKVFKIVIPIIILVKLLTEFGLIAYLSAPLEPIMALVGVPSEYGLAWAASMLVNLYSGIIVIVGLLPETNGLTIAQASTLSLMCLIAHSLLVECKIAQECGVSFISQIMIRFVIALIGGIGLHVFYSVTDIHTAQATILLDVPQNSGLMAWALNETINLVRIFFIIWIVLMMHGLLTKLRITDFLEKVLSPLLRLLGMSSATASTIVVAFCAGIVYGSGLIIKYSHDGKMSKKDLFCAITLMGLAHALIEDTILMMLVGGSIWVTFGYRVILVLLSGVVISYLYDIFVANKQRRLS